ncbi:hypothetical protein [Paenibacillus jamilae]|uniref:hypothetical protein n=1 Tax=Paenibacillus jamilae TaxID=114136 RepID=UPI0014289542|nr:hypothetical protein [Paenibacillus jamilae]
MFSDHGAASRKGVRPMVNLVSCYDVLRWMVTLLSLVFSVRKLYRWLRRKFRNKRKPTA